MTLHSINRRRFIQLTGGVAMLSLIPRGLYGFANEAVFENPGDGRISIPFHDSTDVLICGSTLHACDLAVRVAKSGKRVTLVMDRVNPLFEGIACLQTWLDAEKAGTISELIRPCIENPKTSEKIGGRVYYNGMKAAIDVEDALCEAGVRFYYNAAVAGAIGADGRLAGVAFGGKTGLFAVEAPVIVDATPEATIARAAGARFAPKTGPQRYLYLLDLLKPVPARTTSFAASNGLNAKVSIHHYFAEFEMEVPNAAGGPLGQAEDFEKIYAAALECPWEGDERRFRGADAYLTSGRDKLDAREGRVAEFDNLLVFGPHGIEGNRDGSLVLKNPAALFEAFPKALEQIQAVAATAPVADADREFWNKGVAAGAASTGAQIHSFTDHGFDEPGSAPRRVKFTPPETALKTQVLVTGGGTSGNAASYAAATLGLKTVCLERGLELGGTNTLGGVTNLWYGTKTKAFDNYYKAMNAKNDGMNAPGFFQGTTKAGANVLFGSIVTGVTRQGRNITRVYLATPFGLTAVEAPYHIDAGGDGAIAAWGGAAYTFGGIQDETTLWASYAGFLPGRPEALRPFLSPCDERSALDTTRFILAMRRNTKAGLNSTYLAPPFYLAPRESRHIVGGKTLTYLDVLSGRKFDDTVFRVVSNPDIKGIATSDAAKAGFIPAYWKALFEGRVPYASMIPASLDNVIIAGKAYSVTHDALAIARMQRDLCVMGMAAAEAVKLAGAKGVLLRDVPIKELQAQLLAKEMLEAEDISEDDFGFGIPPEEMAKKVDACEKLDDALVWSAMLCVIPKEKALAALAPYANSSNPATLRVLAFLGEPKAVDKYLAQVGQALDQTPLALNLFGQETAPPHQMPDQGYAPESALQIGALINNREPRTVPLLVKLGEKVDVDKDQINPTWGYLFMLSNGFERLTGPEGAAPLKRTLDGSELQNRIVTRAEDLRKCKNYIPERYAYLRMALARALTRCGDPRGPKELCAFLNEARVCFARAARAELVAAFGKDHRFDAAAWEKTIQSESANLKPNPDKRVYS